MKKIFCAFVSVLTVLLTSCSQDATFEVSMKVTPTEVRNGEEITISFEKSEDTNVDFKAEVFWEDVKIGEVSKDPYQMKYVVNETENGFHTIRCTISYGKKKGTTSSVGVVKKFAIINVVE